MTGSGLGDIFHSTAFVVARNLGLFVVAVFWLGLAYWVYRDARRRLDDWWLVGTATLLGLVPIFGPLAYLLFRPPETLADVQAREIEVRALRAHLRRPEPSCPVCRSAIEKSYLVCPVCTTQLKKPCVSCKAPLEPLWQACPYCATPVGATVEPLGTDLDTALTAEAAAIPQQRRAGGRRAAAS
ncbi:MAG TPA: zinc ribbon domain-containing protein [Gaiellaceae bacterium]|nr:zinc ribbon domain-containing protein [Gaiellaceae bacterium]